MRYESHDRSVIMLVDGESKAQCSSARNWLNKSRFSVRQAKDLSEALEQISDFTTGGRPDVVMLEMDSVSQQFDGIERVIHMFSAIDETPVFVLSQKERAVNRGKCFEGDLAQISEELNRMFPANARRHTA